MSKTILKKPEWYMNKTAWIIAGLFFVWAIYSLSFVSIESIKNIKNDLDVSSLIVAESYILSMDIKPLVIYAPSWTIGKVGAYYSTSDFEELSKISETYPDNRKEQETQMINLIEKKITKYKYITYAIFTILGFFIGLFIVDKYFINKRKKNGY